MRQAETILDLELQEPMRFLLNLNSRHKEKKTRVYGPFSLENLKLLVLYQCYSHLLADW